MNNPRYIALVHKIQLPNEFANVIDKIISMIDRIKIPNRETNRSLVFIAVLNMDPIVKPVETATKPKIAANKNNVFACV